MTKLLMLLFSTLAITSCATILQNNTIVEVRAKPESVWTDTGVSVTSADQVSVHYVRGQWKPNPAWGPTDAAGSDKFIARGGYLRPGSPEGSLIGKVGGDSYGGGSETFFIGNEGSVPLGLKGLLWLTVNDQPRGFFDNSGSIFVEIKVKR
jgi:hypothetical protein